MSVTPQPKTTWRFVDFFPYLALLIAAGMFLSILGSVFLGRTLISQNLIVSPDAAGALPPIVLKQEAIGALRIDVRAIVPSNQWVTYEIQLKDQQGKVLTSGIKQAWRESGSWAEEGESGSWEESDVESGLDVRSRQKEPITIAIEILEYSDTIGQDIDTPVTFAVKVQNGVVDSRYLAAGWIGTSILAILSLLFVPSSGKTVINKFMKDSEVAAREVLGGPNRLLRVNVKILANEHSASMYNVRLIIKDGNGEPIYERNHQVYSSLSKNDSGKVKSGSSSLCTFFVIEPRGSYSVFANVSPSSSIKRTTLLVKEGARTIVPIQAIYLKST